MVDLLCRKVDRRLRNFDRPECRRTLATEPVPISTQIWAERLLLMRVETLKARKTEENERLWKREEEAREQSERLWKTEDEAREQEEEAREQRERLRKRKESHMSSYSAVIQEFLLQRNRVRDRVLPAEELRAYINSGQ
jgi:hypothetical protein